MGVDEEAIEQYKQGFDAREEFQWSNAMDAITKESVKSARDAEEKAAAEEKAEAAHVWASKAHKEAGEMSVAAQFAHEILRERQQKLDDAEKGLQKQSSDENRFRSALSAAQDAAEDITQKHQIATNAAEKMKSAAIAADKQVLSSRKALVAKEQAETEKEQE